MQVKLVLALLWQRAARERRDGGEEGFGYVMEQLRLAHYEGSDEADANFVQDMEKALSMVLAPGAENQLQTVLDELQKGQDDTFKKTCSTDFHRRSVAVKVLVVLDFCAYGL